jgi:hypothetical protein
MFPKVFAEADSTPIGLGEPAAHLNGEVTGNIIGRQRWEPAYADTIGSGGCIYIVSTVTEIADAAAYLASDEARWIPGRAW